MKVGDLIRVKHHSVERNGKIGLFVRKQQHFGFRDMHIVKFPDGGVLTLTIEQCEVMNESR